MNSARFLGLHSTVQSLSKDVPRQMCLCLTGTKEARVASCVGSISCFGLAPATRDSSRTLLWMALPGVGSSRVTATGPRWKLDADLYRCSRGLDRLNSMMLAISIVVLRFRHDGSVLARQS